MKPIFADSFYYFALSNREDESHERAYEFSAGYVGKIVTTEWILTEVADGFAAPRLRPLFVHLIAQIKADPMTKVVGVSRSLFKKGVELYSRRTDKGWSLTDCISFVVMRELGLSNVLSGDRHFQQAGFRNLL